MTTYCYLLIINIRNGQRVYDWLKVLLTVVTEPDIVASSAPVYDRQLWPSALWNILVRETAAHWDSTEDENEVPKIT